MKITIAGDLGSGKSSVAKEVSKILKFEYISTGYLHRTIAEEYKVDALKLNEIAKDDMTIDNRIDGYLISLNKSNEDLIIDSRMAWHFVKDSFRIYFEVNQDIGAERVLADKSRFNEPLYDNKITALGKLNERKGFENARFYEKYNVDCNNLSNYDIIINTSFATINEIVNLLVFIINIKKKQECIPKYWISPKLLYPTEDIRLIARPQTKEIKNDISANNFNMNYPIDCVKFDNFYFIWDGHKRCSGALYNNLSFVPITIIAKDNDEIHNGHKVSDFVNSVLNQSLYYDWEDAHNFRYSNYPTLTNTFK